MKARTIGLAIGEGALRAVGVVGDHVRWAVEVERAPEETLAAALDALIKRCPIPRWPRPRVIAAVGPAASQVKRLTGLPPLRDPRDLTAAVRESTRRFFLQNGTPLLTTDLEPLAPGEAWAAAIEAPVVDAVALACRSAGLKLVRIVPTAVALPHALLNPEITWRDGSVRTTIGTHEGRIAVVTRTLASDADEAPPLQPVGALATLGDRALAFADAYGAAHLPRETPLVYRPGRPDRLRPPSRRRLLVAAVAAVVGPMLAFIVPGVAARVAGTRADAEFAVLAPADRAVGVIEERLAQATAALRAMQAFDAGRPSPTRLLRDLTRVLPTHTALVALTVDSTTGTLVALSRDPTAVVNALERVSGIASPQMLGPVTPEAVGSASLQRVTVQFRVLLPPTDSSTPTGRRAGR